MKRVLLAASLLLVASSAFAFNPKAQSPVASDSPRVGVLRMSEQYEHAEGSVARMVVRYLRDELRSRGIDAYDTGLTYEEVANGKGDQADYYVEIIGTDADSISYAGLDVGSWDAGVSVDLVVSHVAGELRLYDGSTGKLVISENLKKRKHTLMPTSVYLGGSRVFAALTVPFVQHAQMKSVTRSAARDAAQVVVAALQPHE
ncbi:MAG: hypothetical protein DMF56_05540 [Acidobacteria bacterium]|nr:MAG: hypothetical protein DMF56_05540 [Acidobacteriota bacterium]